MHHHDRHHDPHDHEMGDAENFNGSGSDDSDWASFEEGEEDESQIEAVETMLQQRDEGGLGRTIPRRGNERVILPEEDDEDDEDDDEDEDDEMSDELEGFNSSLEDDLEDGNPNAVANFVLRGLGKLKF